jgi:GDP-L-fucose synthase
MINKKSRIFVTGHKGLVGSAVVRRLNHYGYKNILNAEKKKLDLRNQKQVFNFFKKKKLMLSLMQPEKLVGFTQTINTRLILFMTI